MEIKQIITKRRYESWPSFDLVYEWEDIFMEVLKAKPYLEKRYYSNKYRKRIPFIKYLLTTPPNAFIYEMSPIIKYHIWNKKNILPCIIDFYLTQKDLNKFYQAYNKNPIVLLSSKEVFHFLKKNNCPLNIAHLPLSISDKYKIDNESFFYKEYDLVMVGRQNSILEKFTYKYAETHKDFTFVYRKQKGNQFLYYTSNNECLGDINTRDKYIQLMRKSRCALYSTPGIDGGEKRTKGFNQVTPRFLELIASGCHIIARYKENPDTDFYHLKDFSDSINTYKEFESRMDKARKEAVDMKKYTQYLSQHYTSERVKLLKNLIQNL